MLANHGIHLVRVHVKEQRHKSSHSNHTFGYKTSVLLCSLTSKQRVGIKDKITKSKSTTSDAMTPHPPSPIQDSQLVPMCEDGTASSLPSTTALKSNNFCAVRVSTAVANMPRVCRASIPSWSPKSNPYLLAKAAMTKPSCKCVACNYPPGAHFCT